MTIRHRRTAAGAALTMTGLLLAACSSSSGSGAHTPTKSSNAASTAGSSGVPSAAATPLAAASLSAHTSAAAHSVAGGSACTLITEQDVTTSVGTDPGKGNASSSHGAPQCSYGSYPGQVLTVSVLPTGGQAGYDRLHRDPQLVSGTGLSVANVTGLGDQAFELSGPHTDALYFTNGDALVTIGLTTPTAPTKGAALTLAKIAAGRL